MPGASVYTRTCLSAPNPGLFAHSASVDKMHGGELESGTRVRPLSAALARGYDVVGLRMEQDTLVRLIESWSY